jgi:hypothetical protein
MISDSHPALVSLLTVIPLQKLAYDIAVLCCCNVYQPMNLAKSETVEKFEIGCSFIPNHTIFKISILY